MTQTAAIAAALLRGDVLSIMSGFKMFACSNLPREISRSIEAKLGVEVSRVKKDFVSQYGQSGYYFEYRLNRTPYNEEGIQKMKKYLKEHRGTTLSHPKTEKQAKLLKQTVLFMESI